MLRHLDVEQLAALVVDLQGGVLKLELFVELVLEPAAGRVTVAFAGYEHVGRQRGKPGADLPDVKVVDLGDIGLLDEGAADRVGVKPPWRRFEEDPPGIAQRP